MSLLKSMVQVVEEKKSEPSQGYKFNIGKKNVLVFLPPPPPLPPFNDVFLSEKFHPYQLFFVYKCLILRESKILYVEKRLKAHGKQTKSELQG